MLDLGLIPFKEIIHLASHLAIKNEVARFPEPLGSQQLPLRFFSCTLRPWSKKSYCLFCAVEGKNFGHCIEMPKSGLEVICNPSSDHHDWLSLLIIPSRSSGLVYTAIQLQLGVATLRVKGPVATLDCFMGESRNQDASVGGGRNRSFQRRSKEARGGDWFSARGEQGSSHCLCAIIQGLFSRPITQFLLQQDWGGSVGRRTWLNCKWVFLQALWGNMFFPRRAYTLFSCSYRASHFLELSTRP